MEQEVVDAAGAVVARFRSDLVDVEAQPLPYRDGAFDTVLLCEVIEHFVADPVFALGEIHRVLAPGRAAAAHDAERRAGREPAPPGPAPGHLRPLLALRPPRPPQPRVRGRRAARACWRANGFAVERYLTRPVHGVPDPDPAWFAAADDDGAGDYHFVVARRGEPVEPVRPAWLYR